MFQLCYVLKAGKIKDLFFRSIFSCTSYRSLRRKRTRSKSEIMSVVEKTAEDQELRKKIWTPPFDARFPNQNQTRNCWQNYVDYFRCQKIKGEDYAPCEYFKKVYTHLCPGFWVEQWDEQRESGTFAGKI